MKTMRLEELRQKIGDSLTLEICQKVSPEISVDLERLSSDDWLDIYRKTKHSGQQKGVTNIMRLSGIDIITSPTVGTFGAAGQWPSGDKKPLVKAGDHIKPDTIVCGIEAMMVQNPIKAGVCGTIAEVLAKNGQAVYFDEVLFLVKLDP